MQLYNEMMKFFRNHLIVLALLTKEEAAETPWYKWKLEVDAGQGGY